jgi:O-succinylbenzoic acid--CoA ligase
MGDVGTNVSCRSTSAYPGGVPAVVVPTGPDELYTALRAALTEPPSSATVVALEAPGHDPSLLPGDAALVVRTSGSTGAPREVVATRSALLASIEATAARLGGHGRWLLALPWHHVAGAQVVARSVVAGTTPASLPAGEPFTSGLLARVADEFFATGTGAPAGRSPTPTYLSLVPTQLHRVMTDAADPTGRRALDALRRFDAVLVGGAATAPALLAQARSAGVRVVTTYGMSETCGGCVYDGRPLDGVRVRVAASGRVELGGPVVAWGYLGDPDATTGSFGADDDGTRWFRTSDVGAFDADTAQLRVLGRADDVIVTGGEKVAPLAVEHALDGIEGVGEVCVVGIDDAEWGTAVAVVLVDPGAPGLRPAPDALRRRVREAVRERAGRRAVPRHVVVAPALPLRGPGKVDRRTLAAQVASAVRAGG